MGIICRKKVYYGVNSQQTEECGQMDRQARQRENRIHTAPVTNKHEKQTLQTLKWITELQTFISSSEGIYRFNQRERVVSHKWSSEIALANLSRLTNKPLKSAIWIWESKTIPVFVWKEKKPKKNNDNNKQMLLFKIEDLSNWKTKQNWSPKRHAYLCPLAVLWPTWTASKPLLFLKPVGID